MKEYWKYFAYDAKMNIYTGAIHESQDNLPDIILEIRNSKKLQVYNCSIIDKEEYDKIISKSRRIQHIDDKINELKSLSGSSDDLNDINYAIDVRDELFRMRRGYLKFLWLFSLVFGLLCLLVWFFLTLE